MATCDVCNRPLTDPDSIARGRGPVCGGRGCVSTLSASPGETYAGQGVLWAHQLPLGLSFGSVQAPALTRSTIGVQLALDLPPAKARR